MKREGERKWNGRKGPRMRRGKGKGNDKGEGKEKRNGNKETSDERGRGEWGRERSNVGYKKESVGAEGDCRGRRICPDFWLEKGSRTYMLNKKWRVAHVSEAFTAHKGPQATVEV